MGDIWNVLHELKPAIIMLAVQAIFAGINVLYKIAASDGMNLSILVFYRFLFATGFIGPVAFFAERYHLYRLLVGNIHINPKPSPVYFRNEWIILFLCLGFKIACMHYAYRILLWFWNSGY